MIFISSFRTVCVWCVGRCVQVRSIVLLGRGDGDYARGCATGIETRVQGGSPGAAGRRYQAFDDCLRAAGSALLSDDDEIGGAGIDAQTVERVVRVVAGGK